MSTKPPITANNRVDFRRQSVIVTGDTSRPLAIDKEPTIPIRIEKKGISAGFSFEIVKKMRVLYQQIEGFHEIDL